MKNSARFKARFLLEPLDVNLVQISGRLGANGSAQWWSESSDANRLWFGQIGEFLVFTTPLTYQEEKEILAYLRQKWFKNVSVEAPQFLHDSDVVDISKVDLEMQDGTTLKHQDETLPIASLNLSGAIRWECDFAEGGPLKMFNVLGDLSFTQANITLAPSSFPTGRNELISYQGELLSDDATWQLEGEKADRASVRSDAPQKSYSLLLNSGTLLLLQ